MKFYDKVVLKPLVIIFQKSHFCEKLQEKRRLTNFISFREEISWVLKEKERNWIFGKKIKFMERFIYFGKVGALKCMILCDIFHKGKI